MKPVANIVKTVENAVVGMYMDVIRQGFEKAGYETNTLPNRSTFPKKEMLVTDTATTALRYYLKGYRKQCIWYQGIVPEESYMRNHSTLRFRVLSAIEKFTMKRAKLVFFVSQEMKRFYEKKYRLHLDKKAVIMPCFNEDALTDGAFEDAQKYSDNTFVYVGSLHVWQCFEETAKLYAEIEKAAGGNTTFYVFTAEQDKAKSILEKYGAKNYHVDYVPADELSQRIKRMKYGFVLRQDHPVNNVATPTKFSNYLSNGIIPVYSGCLRSFAEYDTGLRLGIVCDLDDPDAGVARIREHMAQEHTAEEIRAKCEKAFAEYYNRHVYIETIAEKVSEEVNP